MNVKKIITDLGGVAKITQQLNIPFKSTIYGWILRNRIPEWRIDKLREIAREQGISEDIFYNTDKTNK